MTTALSTCTRKITPFPPTPSPPPLNPPPSYPAAIAEFARVFTGWTNQPSKGVVPYWNAYINMKGPLVSIASFHDAGSKTLLNGQVIPQGLTPQADLDAALDNIANHPNVAPFI